jgi:hypothetical protein
VAGTESGDDGRVGPAMGVGPAVVRQHALDGDAMAGENSAAAISSARAAEPADSLGTSTTMPNRLLSSMTTSMWS